MDEGFKGTVKLKPELKHTDFIFGTSKLIAGKELLFISQNEEGHCDCLWGATGIVTVDRRDIEEINHNRLVDPEKYISEFYDEKTKLVIQKWLNTKSQDM